MIYDRDSVDLIERSNDAQRYCACGKHTMPVWRNGAIWLDCASLTEPSQGRLGRLRAALTSYTHTHEHLLEAPLPSEERAQRAA